MSSKRRNRRKMQRDGNTAAASVVTIIGKFIDAGYLAIDTKNYHVSMLDNFWSLYKTEERQLNLLNNLRFYCNIMNAYRADPADPEAVLLVSMKDEAGEVEPKFYYKNGTIALID